MIFELCTTHPSHVQPGPWGIFFASLSERGRHYLNDFKMMWSQDPRLIRQGRATVPGDEFCMGYSPLSNVNKLRLLGYLPRTMGRRKTRQGLEPLA